MELSEAKDILEDRDMLIDTLFETYNQSTVKPFDKAIDTILKALDNSISKDILNEYLVEAQERYDVYKNAVKENEDLRTGVHRYLGQVELLKRILGIPINYVTLDKE